MVCAIWAQFVVSARFSSLCHVDSIYCFCLVGSLCLSSCGLNLSCMLGWAAFVCVMWTPFVMSARFGTLNFRVCWIFSHSFCFAFIFLSKDLWDIFFKPNIKTCTPLPYLFLPMAVICSCFYHVQLPRRRKICARCSAPGQRSAFAWTGTQTLPFEG